jgi:hypothetical protein
VFFSTIATAARPRFAMQCTERGRIGVGIPTKKRLRPLRLQPPVPNNDFNELSGRCEWIRTNYLRVPKHRPAHIPLFRTRATVSAEVLMELHFKDMRSSSRERLAIVRNAAMPGVGTNLGTLSWGDPLG